MKKHAYIKTEKNRRRFSLTKAFALIVFIVLIAAVLFGALAISVLTWAGVISGFSDQLSLGTVLVCVLDFSIVSGAAISLVIALVPLQPVNELIDHMNKLAGGDFKARLNYTSSIGNHKVFAEIKDSLNKLAEELENTEILKSDFINNFSHEFKTPIVSIAGLAKLLNDGKLSEEERERYLTAIEEESKRLSTMATKVLNLTKVENQSILTEISRFNLSEQIRSCILLLDDKWTKKNIELEIDFDEYDISANYELLKEVWINLVDNAVKFTDFGGTVSLVIKEDADFYTVSVGNSAPPIPEEHRTKIFSKFYQADSSNTSGGNGIGLAIVNKIVTLHNGSVSVGYENGMVVFSVRLPKKQG